MSDTIMYVISSSHGISIEGDYLLDIINVHCSPEVSFIQLFRHRMMKQCQQHHHVFHLREIWKNSSKNDLQM